MAGKQVIQADQQRADLYALTVAMAAPETPSAGIGPKPKMNNGSSAAFRMMLAICTHGEAHFADGIEHRLQRHETEHRDHADIADMPIERRHVVDIGRNANQAQQRVDRQRTNGGKGEGDHPDHQQRLCRDMIEHVAALGAGILGDQDCPCRGQPGTQ